MRLFMLLILSLSLTGLLGCGEDQTPDLDPTTGSPTGSGNEDKPTAEENRQLAAAKKQFVAVVHKSAQVLAFNNDKAVIRVTTTINNQPTRPITLVMDGETDVQTFDNPQDGVDGLKLEILYVRAELGNGNRSLIGLEYRLSREVGSKTYIASQFISLRSDMLNAEQKPFKRKFEFPSKTNLYTWIRQ